VRLLLAGAVLGCVYGALALFVGRHLPARTTVDGIAVGGMSPDAATVTLRTVLGTVASRPIHLQGPSRTVDIDPGAAGLEVDLEATLSDLSGLTLNPVTLWAHLAGGEDQRLKIRVDRAKLAAAVSDAAGVIDLPVKEGSITFTGGAPTVVASAAGNVVRVDATTGAVVAAWPRQQNVMLVMDLIPPQLSADEINRAARDFAVPAMSGPVTVTAGEVTFLLQPAQFAPSLSMVADGSGTLQPRIDAPQLLAVIRKAGPAIDRPPVDASVQLVAGAPTVVPAVIGSTLDVPAVPATFLAALTSPARTALLTMAPVPPTVTTATAQSWGIKQEISTFTTHFPFNPPRTNNIKIAVRALNGTLVRPGAQFSLNGTLGPRTPSKGYQQAPVINGGRLVTDYGGGVSQVSTTTFNAAFFAGVKIEKYTPHSFYISRYPEGREATVSWPDVDQLWTNDTGFGILIKAYVSGSDLTVTFLGTKTWDIESVKGPRRNVAQPKQVVDDRPGCVPQAPTAGFDVTVTRIFIRNGVQIKSSQFNTHYIPEDNVRCTGPAAG